MGSSGQWYQHSDIVDWEEASPTLQMKVSTAWLPGSAQLYSTWKVPSNQFSSSFSFSWIISPSYNKGCN